MSQDIPPSASADAPLTLREAASFLKCSTRTIQRLVHGRLLRVRFVGNSPRFLRSDLLKAMQPVAGGVA